MRWLWLRKREKDLERELSAHLELESEEQQQSGLPKEAANYAARRTLGNTTLLKENVRETWGWPSAERLLHDLRYAFRGLRRTPQFTCVAVSTLALGIGANTGLFTVFNSVLLKTLPVERPHELLNVLPLDRHGEDMGFSWPLFEALERDQQVFSGIYAASDIDPLDLNSTGQKISVQMVSGDYFAVLGVGASLGRSLMRDDNLRGAQPVAVISHGFWERQFGRDPSVLGRRIALNHQPLTIVGVAAREFFGDTVGSAPDVWAPVILVGKLNPGHDFLDSAGVTFLHVVGRLKTAVAQPEALAGLALSLPHIQSVANSQNSKLFRDVNRLTTSSASRGLSELREQFSKPLRFLMALVALVLLLACANVANLLLARTAARQKDLAIRLATGASYVRVLRQMLAESLLLAAFGGALGLWIGYALSHFLVAVVAGSIDRMVLDIDPDFRLLAFTFLASFATGLIFGVGPALAAMRVDPIQSLKAGAARQKRGLGAGRAIVIGQVALSLLLATAAGLFARSLYNLRTFNLGFARDGVLQIALDPSAAGYKGNALMPFYERVTERLNQLPGVRATSFASLDLLGGGGGHICCLARSGVPLNGNDDQRVFFNTVMPGYFKATGMTISGGRAFNKSDLGAAHKNIVLNERLATKLFGDVSPVGRYLTFGWGTKVSRLEVVGIVHNARYSHVQEAVQGMAYFPQTTNGDAMRMLYLRTNRDPRNLIPTVLKELKAIDSGVPVERVEAIGEIIDRDLLEQRLVTQLSVGFGILALVLAIVGLYGLLAYSVARRTGEIGIRAALGAQRREVIAMVIKDGVWLVAIGLIIGLPAAWGIAHLASSMLFGFSASDPLTFLIAIGALVGAGVLASCFPAWRASRVDPVVALRYE